MIRHAILLLLALATSSAAAQQLYVRGAFNGWGTANPLRDKGAGVYEADILVSPGYHAFKIGNGDWSEEWVASVPVRPGHRHPLAKGAGPEDYLFAKQAATYRFTVDMSDLAAPALRVQPLALAQADTRDPHGQRATFALDFATWDGSTVQARFSAQEDVAGLRTYVHSTTQQLRDPGPPYRSYGESAALPRTRSGNLAFDALFAMAVAEMRENAVSQVRDGNYNGGGAIDCACFETGEKWNYVWTRDLAYAAHLGLALLDPQRVRNSLAFKLSGYRDGVERPRRAAGSADGLQIVQDTGSGGSWPVSTDRVAWAFAADEVLKTLPVGERAPFAARALAALSNTLENDRLAAFDRRTGMYTGEQSFLDWRDQSYAAWIPADLASMASASALSTNVAHYQALRLAARLAREHGASARAKRYAGWARDLRRAINRRLWLPRAGMYSSLTAGHFDGTPLHKFDWLGQSLAIIAGVASPAQAKRILASYPHGPMGAPVIWPQQHGVPVYHNRAIWPFVTAYGLRAASMAGNVAVADAAYATLVRGAALALSNMENLEWLTGQPLLLDERNPALGGPVINSRRQLWSVGAYLGMVIGNVFGVSATTDGIALRPFVTARLRREMFAGVSQVTLHGLRIHGKRISVRLRLPPAAAQDGYYRVTAVTLNGAPATTLLPSTRLGEDNVVEIALGQLQPGQQQIRRVAADPYAEPPSVFGPREPQLTHDLQVACSGDACTLYRDGRPARGAQAGCYSAEAVYLASGNRSHHSAPVCTAPVIASGSDGAFTIAATGRYALQARYGNRANQVNLGITAGVKWLAVKNAAGRVVAEGVVQMPHAPAQAYSTPLPTRLTPGRYTVQVDDFYNMSYLKSNETFSGAGGTPGAWNRPDIGGFRLTRVQAPHALVERVDGEAVHPTNLGEAR